QESAGNHSYHDGHAHGPAALGAGTEADGDRQNTGDGREGGHQNRAQPDGAGLQHGLARVNAFGPLLVGEFDEQNRVFGHQADQQHQADLAEQIQIHRRNDRQNPDSAAPVQQPQQ